MRSIKTLDPARNLPPPPPAPPVAHVVNVALGVVQTQVLWTFDTAVASVTSPARELKVNGSPANDGAAKIGPFVVAQNFTDDVNSGDPWSVVPIDGGVLFTNGALLTAQSGTIS